MKSIQTLFLISIALLVFSKSDAQSQFIISIGYSHNAIINQEVDDIPNIVGKGAVTVGVQYSLPITTYAEIQFGFRYAASDFEIAPSTLDTKSQLTHQGRYLSIPVLLRFQVLPRTYALAGPLLAFDLTKDPSPYINKQSGLGFHLGLAYEYPYNKLRIGISPFITNYALVPFQSEDKFRQAIQVGASLTFGFSL
ncbi:MAG: hypothetical protein RIS47_2257 [Bacteroidota bacterium]|jgi:hypothetical protein